MTEYMTIREVAELFGVTKQAITKHVDELYPDKMTHGKTTYLNEDEITEIKHNMRQTTLVVSAVTELEMQQKALDVLEWMSSKVKELEQQNEEMKPKAISYDTFIQTENLHSMSEVAKALGTGRNKLFRILRDQNILRENNEPYQRFIDNKCFETKQKVIANGEAIAVTCVTAKGLVYIEKTLKQIKE